MSDKWVIPERAAALQEGSYERKTHAIREWLKESDDLSGQVLASFDSKFFVLSDDKTTYKVTYEWTEDGMEVRAVHEAEDVAVGRQGMGEYVCKEMKESARLISQGNAEAAQRRLKGILEYVDRGAQDWLFDEVTESIGEIAGSSKDWQELRLEHKDRVDTWAIEYEVTPDHYVSSLHESRAETKKELIRKSVAEMIVSVDHLLEDVSDTLYYATERLEEVDASGVQGARTMSEDLARFRDLLEDVGPYLEVASRDALIDLHEVVVGAIERFVEGYVTIQGALHE